jgi:phosphoenolpyruvate carboxykinase (GTP)
MGDYFKHWIEIGEKTSADKLPKIFYVNWFRKTADGKWLWPGYGENSRVLKWVFERCNNEGGVAKTPIGYMPTADAIERAGLPDVSDSDMKELLTVDREGWQREIVLVKEHYAKFGSRLPQELTNELVALEKRLS